ncbi:MAG: molybdopterin-dependent oxidoreductase, partial [Armatimonadota bacterium]
FLAAYGTGTVGNHTAVCEASKWVAQELTWGSHYDNWDFENTRCIVNFGCNVFEAHTNHIPMAQRCAAALARGVRMYTFDVRLSNTAARSTEWIPIRPGTDLAVVLAMCNVLMNEGLYDREFIETYTNVSIGELEEHLSEYTPAWASKVSGVSAEKIRSIALEYGSTKPSVCLSYRGAVMHYNGVQTERAILMLEAICGNVDAPGGRCKAVGAKWKNTYPTPKTKAHGLKIVDGEGYAYPTHHVNHQIFKMIREGKHGRPDVYMFYCHNPVYVNGEVAQNIAVMKDENLLPYIVAVDVAYSESAALADLILPDATYLERWDWEDMVSYDQIPEYYIRQPAVQPLGEARDFKDVCCEMARRLGGDVAAALPFSSAEEFVRDACENTPGVKEAGGFGYMKKHGAWVDPAAKPRYRSYARDLGFTPEQVAALQAGKEVEYESKGKTIKVVLDQATGVVWSPEAAHVSPEDVRAKGYQDSKNAYKGYVGQLRGDRVYLGFPPDKVNKSGLFEIRSELLAKKGLPAMPTYVPIPDHERMKPGELILTTYKVNVQTHSRTQGCKWLTEIYHDNPAWINPRTARERGIRDGDEIRIRSAIGEMVTRARVTDGIHPQAIAISYHCGHWEWGRYASGRPAPAPGRGDVEDGDLERIWWADKRGAHPNWIIPNRGDPIGGQMRWMDTVVTVEKA